MRQLVSQWQFVRDPQGPEHSFVDTAGFGGTW
jgi:hypothetical protein